MRDRDSARLLGVVDEVALAVVRRVFADDLRRFLVRADGAVAAESVEDAASDVVLFGVEARVVIDARVRDVVFNADGEVVLELARGHRVVNTLDHRGREVFRRESETAAVHLRQRAFPRLRHRGDDVEVKRFARRARFLRAVEDRELFDRLRERLDERFGGERTVEADVEKTDLLVHPDRVEIFLDDARAARHHDDDVFRVRIADVVEEMILTSGELRELIHLLLDDRRNGGVERIARFARLEEDVGVLRRAAYYRVRGVETALAELLDEVEIEHGANGLFGQLLELADLVGGAEPVEEVDERNAALVSRSVGDERKVVRFLNGAAREHRPTAGAGRHDVGVIAEDRKRVRRDAARGDVEDGRRLLARDLEHVRDHEEQPLRRGERAGQRARLKRAVDRARGARFALHFNDLGDRSKEVLLALRRPVVGKFAHGRRRRDRVNRHDFVAKMRDHCSGFITVAHNKAFFVAHCRSPLQTHNI